MARSICIHPRRLRFAGVLALLTVAALAPGAQALTASETVSGGTLGFINSTPANITFPGVSVNGSSAQTVTQTQALDVDDARGTGAGWNITATSTTFTDGSGDTLPTTAVTIQSAPALACDTSGACTLASESGITYPYTLPAASTAPTATKLFNAASASGLAAQTVTPTWQLVVPAAAKAGAYTSTWTISLVSGP